jgi:hypothetical protein
MLTAIFLDKSFITASFTHAFRLLSLSFFYQRIAERMGCRGENDRKIKLIWAAQVLN